jgi:hypothetical protein
MPAFNILERLRWKVGLGLVIVAAGFATQAAHSAGPASEVARSSWGSAESTDVARSSWGKIAVGSTTLDVPAADSIVPLPESTDVARSSWGSAEAADVA